MQVNDMLQILGADPTQLPPAANPPARPEEAFARVGRTPQPCVACGEPATATRIANVPGVGPCWIDTCTPHMIAIAKTATSAPGSEALTALRAAVRQADVDVALLTVPLAEAECPRG
ncbi:hypothetical protein ABZS88_46850 [Streptomyces sp. NPDC005480]|uniref:hypothetical protein n=1 Tax=Streptomyces sp. NPDC005480 TaxID=3154880 RepID=UPI0033A17CB7